MKKKNDTFFSKKWKNEENIPKNTNKKNPKKQKTHTHTHTHTHYESQVEKKLVSKYNKYGTLAYFITNNWCVL